jgi:hypothetical protein
VAALVVGQAPSQLAFRLLASRWLRISWAGPDGNPRTGNILASGSLRPGAPLLVWVDASGQLTGPPLQHSQAARREVLAAVLAAAGLAVLLLGARATVHWLVDRRRRAAWDTEWELTGPLWSAGCSALASSHRVCASQPRPIVRHCQSGNRLSGFVPKGLVTDDRVADRYLHIVETDC